MLYEISGSYQYPDLPTEKVVDVSLYYSKQILSEFETNKERPVFNASDLEGLAISIINELCEIELELKKEYTKKKMENFPLANVKYLAYLEDNSKHKTNRMFTSFIEDVHNQFLLVLSLFAYKSYSLVLDDTFRKHYFEYRFIAYLTICFYYESVQYDKKIRKHNEREAAILDSPIEEGITLKDLIAAKEESNLSEKPFNDLLNNDLLIESLKDLSSQQQSILSYYYVSGFNEREISEILKISQQAVSKAKRKAIDKLKKIMKGG